MAGSHRLRLGLALLLAAAVHAASPRGSAAATWEQTAWADTVYYRTSLRADRAGDAILHVAAADRWDAYLNGDAVGADSVAGRMTSVPVSVRRFGNELAVRVVRDADGDATLGHGLLALLANDSLRVETSTNPAVQAWYWSAGPFADDDWSTAAFEDRAGWFPVQAGSLDASRVDGLVDSGLTAIVGLPGGIDAGRRPGSLVLGRIDGVNLALGQPSNREDVTDGDLDSSWDPPTSSMNFFAAIDLQSRPRIDCVRVLTRGRSESQFEENSLRGYSVQVSDDDITWSEVGQLRGIDRYAWTEVAFPSIAARHVRIVINELDPATSPRVAEVQVLGTGLRAEATYTSPPLRLDSVSVNPGRVTWEATTPARTGLHLQVRSSADDAGFEDADSGWSDDLASGAWFPAPEPVTWVQYRVRMTTDDGETTPTFDALRIDYDRRRPASGARAWITPTAVPMAVDTTIVVHLDVEVADDDAGVAAVTVTTPGPAVLDETAPLAAQVADWSSTAGQLRLVFTEPLTASTRLEIPLRTRTHTALHAFRVALFAPGSDNPLNAAEADSADAATGMTRGWSLRATTSVGATLREVRARPRVLTPNGDGINDVTVIGFVLAKLDVPRPVTVSIYDLSGRRVRRLPAARLVGGEHDAVGGPGTWDGRDDAGALVPPGHYLFRVRADLDGGAETAAGLVSVAY